MRNACKKLIENALNPNLVQTKYHTPALVHGGPFANIAHGTNTVIATDLGLKLSDYVVTEAGFGSDLGMEKYLDIVLEMVDYYAPSCWTYCWNDTWAAVLTMLAQADDMYGKKISYIPNPIDIEELPKREENPEKIVSRISILVEGTIDHSLENLGKKKKG